jgi:hypothetical protein
MNGKLIAISLATFIYAGNCYAAPPAHKHKPDFTLTISTQDKTVKSPKDMDIEVSVEEKNISRHQILYMLGNYEDMYTMDVLLDGHPAPITEQYREILALKKPDPNGLLIERGSGSGMAVTINPGESRTYAITLNWYFDMSTPGKYEIIFTTGTDPGRPDNVEVKSNTITVLPSEAQ